MAYSQDFLKELRKTLMETIETVERENAMLSAKIDNFIKPSALEPEEDPNFLEELRLNELINGLAFRNVKKEKLDATTFKITANAVCGQDSYPLEVIAEEVTGKVKECTLIIGDTTPLAEIKQDLAALIKDLHLTFTFNAMASFSRMHKVRIDILANITEYYGDFFKVEANIREDRDGTSLPDSIVVKALNQEEDGYYFEAMWYLKWNQAKISIQHVIIVMQYPEHLAHLPRLVPKLDKLNAGEFIEENSSKLEELWRDIASLVANE